MKHITLLAFILVLTSTLTLSAQQQSVRDLPTFKGISFRTAGKVYIKQGTPQRVEITGNKELVSKIETRVEDGLLIIQREGKWLDWSWNDSDDEGVVINITVQEINRLSVAGSGSMVTQTPIATRDLVLKVSGSGTLTAEVYPTGRLETGVSGSGNLEVRGRAASFEGNVSGSGRIEGDLKVSGASDFSISGSGRVVLSGSTSSIGIEISGSGKVLAAQYQSNSADIRISGSGDAEIWVNSAIESRISGSGSIRYKGNPGKINNNSSGSGSISKL